MKLEEMTEIELRELMKDMANAVKLAGMRWGVERPLFALVVFNDPKIAQYICNCERATTIQALRETADRLESKQDVPR